ncbi:MAG: T9SS type A sorting domain-containing protein [Bacteroidetes bacterium]|nr:T9SS type A sorting domain-containing protein [Bacteroidota bacterium]
MGIPSDDAITGIWTVDVLIPSFVGTGLVQPDVQVTPGGLFCAFTGNAASASSGAGDNDVDVGKTTLISSVQDLTGYTNPAITYHRWYSNDQGATPGTDFWQVAISGDGTTWVPVENTSVADHSWRRFAFKVLYYITPTATVYLRFIAEDANAGSLIEAALDDFKVWDEIPTGTPESASLATVHIFPNPAASSINMNVGLVRDADVSISIINNLGQIVHSYNKNLPAGNNIITVDALEFAAGIYQVQVVTGDSMKTEK